MTQAIIGRWGRNLAMRFPARVAEAAGLGDGQRVELVLQDGDIIIRKLAPEMTAEDIFRGKRADEWRELYSGAYDWGPDRGRERVEE